MASTYLSRTASTPTNNKIWTWSGWVKKNFNSGGGGLFSGYQDGNNWTDFYFSGGNALEMTSYIGASTGIIVNTNAVFRDVSAWYHIVVAYDSTQTTASDRVKFYINGILQTINNTTYPSLNYETKINASSIPQQIGAGAQANFNGSMSHIHFIDGTAYDATAFGEYDANGVWKIKTSPSVTYGNNGFFILKNGNSVTDQSGNGNNFTVAGGTLTQTEDNPSNVFATFNPLWSLDNEGSYSNGNTTWSSSSSNAWYQGMGTLAFSSGKYYWEVKVTGSTNVDKSTIGICGVDAGVQTGQLQDKTPSVFFKNEDGGEMRVNAVTGTDDYGTFAQNDIMGIAVDMDSLTMSLYKNGTILVNAHDISGIGSGSVMTPATMHYNQNTHQYNFGNGYFGTTAVASAGTNASGNGIFEYDVPTGYTALSTKGLNL